MRIEIQIATQFQRDNYDLSGSDSAVMVAINGDFVAWVDDYGTATIVQPELFSGIKEQIEALVFQWAEVATALDSGVPAPSYRHQAEGAPEPDPEVEAAERRHWDATP